MKVVCVIVTYNGAPWIEKCITSLRASTTPIQTIVVDNTSTDNTVELVQQFPEVILMCQTQNLGFGAANNCGLQYARTVSADYVLLLNQDAWIAPEMIGKLIHIAQSFPSYAILSPLYYAADGSRLDPNFETNLRRSVPNWSEGVAGEARLPVYPVTFVNAALWLLPRWTLEQIGGFDPLYFMYGEDVDYCRRVLWHGGQIGVVPEAIGYHVRGKITPSAATSQKITQAWLQTESIRATMLTSLKNPEHSLSHNLRYLVRETGQFCLADLWHGRFALFRARLLALRRLFSLLQEIHQHRQQSLQTAPSWLT